MYVYTFTQYLKVVIRKALLRIFLVLYCESTALSCGFRALLQIHMSLLPIYRVLLRTSGPLLRIHTTLM